MSVLRLRALLLCAAVVLLLLGAAAHTANLAGADDASTAGNLLLALTAVVVLVAFVVPPVRGWLARPRADAGTAIDDTVGRLARRAVAGAVVVVIDGTTVTFHARGHAGPGARPLDESSVFEIGSVTKTFTALVLASMVTDGSVSLDDPVSKYVRAGSIADQVTLLDLATHTAGLRRLPGNRRFLLRALLSDPDPYRDLTERDLEDALRHARPRGTVGTTFRYSNFGFALLGLALARAADRDWADLVADRVCAPLGLSDTGVTRTTEQRNRSARGHDRFGAPVSDWNFASIAPAGALHSTARDLSIYVRAHMEPDATPIAAALVAVQQPRRRRDERDEIALGWLQRRTPTGSVTWHNGGTGGFGSFVGFDRGGGPGVVVLTNTEHSRAVDRAGFAFLGRETEESGLRHPF